MEGAKPTVIMNRPRRLRSAGVRMEAERRRAVLNERASDRG